MKKILPILGLVTSGLLLTACQPNMNNNDNNDLQNNVKLFTESVNEYLNLNENNKTISTMNKYAVSIEEGDVDLISEDTTNDQATENLTIISDEQDATPISPDIDELDEENIEEDIESNPTNQEDDDDASVSPLYSLSTDISESCDQFCELKNQLYSAIIETENLISKLQNNEIDLTPEQKMFITEQSSQLKSLGNKLSQVTNELSFELSDLGQLMSMSNRDTDRLALKYLLILDNLVSGNQMLQSSLASLNMINQMANMNYMNIPNNNQGRVLYGFQKNNEPPIIKDYYIDESGELIENKDDDNESDLVQEEDSENDQNGNIDTYTNTELTSNIDTYGNQNRNIDSFFNTALLNNEFMYGNGYGGYGGYGIYGMNPYINQYASYENFNQNSINDNRLNNQEIDQKNENNAKNIEKSVKNEKKSSKKFKFTKNIDTYRDSNTPDLKTKVHNIKEKVSGFFSKFSRPKEDIKNPIYRYEEDNQ